MEIAMYPKNALLCTSLPYSREVLNFARRLKEEEWTLVTDKDTKRFLKKNGISALDMRSIGGASDAEILGRTLRLLSRPSEECESIGRFALTLLYAEVVTYPQHLDLRPRTLSSIGNHINTQAVGMMLAGVEGQRIVVSSKLQFAEVLDFLKTSGRSKSEYEAFLALLAAQALGRISLHTAIAAQFAGLAHSNWP